MTREKHLLKPAVTPASLSAVDDWVHVKRHYQVTPSVWGDATLIQKANFKYGHQGNFRALRKAEITVSIADRNLRFSNPQILTLSSSLHRLVPLQVNYPAVRTFMSLSEKFKRFDNAQLYRSRLRALATSCFAESSTHVQVFHIGKEALKLFIKLYLDLTSTTFKGGLNELNAILSKSSTATFYFLTQEFSWSPIRISLEEFEGISEYHNIFPEFADVVQSFGIKSDEDSRSWDGSHMKEHVHDSCSNNLTRIGKLNEEEASITKELFAEICYNVRYAEPNGRSQGSPWSLRQMGVYHAFCKTDRTSVWVFIQPSTNFRSNFDSMCQNDSLQQVLKDSGCMFLHEHVFSILGLHWHAYLQFLQEKLNGLVLLFSIWACFSKVGGKRNWDYEVSFADCQELQLLEKKSQRTRRILDSHVEVLRRYRVFSCLGLKRNPHELRRVEEIMSQLMLHRRSVSGMISRSAGIDKLLARIMEFRGNELLHSNERVMQDHLECLRSIATYSQKENEGMVSVSLQLREDSRAMKVLTMIATTYLPATLIATIFGSSLVQKVQESSHVSILDLLRCILGPDGADMGDENDSRSKNRQGTNDMPRMTAYICTMWYTTWHGECGELCAGLLSQQAQTGWGEGLDRGKPLLVALGIHSEAYGIRVELGLEPIRRPFR
ncbi:uncharacterized protein BDR25DRAFT_357066 [Lindgomyces ingoldianus]|uniref:Uncharacterized protein n=1 Tax=Lindgomyces ingoldianus TaxID=673940 RepID=A0ACB6QP63_9PLEO|nr:uncharacterized protein BDR25DRAFT_357066 [Lindgomyces ingoldianus]KAF2468701.1 hypothetical protein BDR25DRAFT_357066 [Lindgomyces ingoldianus]